MEAQLQDEQPEVPSESQAAQTAAQGSQEAGAEAVMAHIDSDALESDSGSDGGTGESDAEIVIANTLQDDEMHRTSVRKLLTKTIRSIERKFQERQCTRSAGTDMQRWSAGKRRTLDAQLLRESGGGSTSIPGYSPSST